MWCPKLPQKYLRFNVGVSRGGMEAKALLIYFGVYTDMHSLVKLNPWAYVLPASFRMFRNLL